MYKNLGYIIYRTVLGYYSGGPGDASEDAYDMRKAMPRDSQGKTVVPMDKPI
jgi:N-terminal acetyltransferase B complex catalytic subunit